MPPGNGSDPGGPIGFEGLEAEPAIGAQLGDELDQASETPPPVLPATFDLFAIHAKNLQKLRERQIDPCVRKVRVYATINGRRAQSCGVYMPEAMSIAWFDRKFPPGVYDLQAVNADNVYVGGGRHVVSERSDSGAGAGGLTPIMEDVLRSLVARGLQSDQNAGGESIARMMQAQSQLMTNAVTLQMQMMSAQREPAAHEQSQMLKFFEMMQAQQQNTMSLLLDRKSSKAQPTKFGDFAGALQMGFELSSMLHRGDTDRTKWEEMIPRLVDSIGPGLIAVVAQAFPAEKGKMVIDLIQEHMKARAAEAEADAVTVDTEGEPVG